MPEAKLKSVRIAVAEDDDDYRRALTTLLHNLGHEVVCEVGNGSDLLQHCSQERVDLVIADLDMPLVDGLEVAEEMAKRGVPVILVSGHPDVEQVNVEHEPLAARLLKPTTSDALQAAIHNAIRNGGRRDRIEGTKD